MTQQTVSLGKHWKLISATLTSEIRTFLPLTVLLLTFRQRSCGHSDLEANLRNCQNQETRLIDEECTNGELVQDNHWLYKEHGH